MPTSCNAMRNYQSRRPMNWHKNLMPNRAHPCSITAMAMNSFSVDYEFKSQQKFSISDIFLRLNS